MEETSIWLLLPGFDVQDNWIQDEAEPAALRASVQVYKRRPTLL